MSFILNGSLIGDNVCNLVFLVEFPLGLLGVVRDFGPLVLLVELPLDSLAVAWDFGYIDGGVVGFVLLR